MRAVAVALMVGLTGCGALPDDKICTAIYDIESSDVGLPSAEVLAERRTNLAWQRQRIETCLHRQAYKLAKADADIESIMLASIERCQPAFAITVGLAGDEQEERSLRTGETALLAFQANSVVASEESERLRRMIKTWIVEGRAGNCRV